MGQIEIQKALLKLHYAITGSNMTCEEILRERRIDTNISLIHQTELTGKVAMGGKVSAEDYYKLGEECDYR